jgi:GNAT superfamily N-acetyltransferase
MGEIVDKTQLDDPDFRWMASLPAWLCPRKLITLGMTMKFLDMANYSKDKAFEEAGKEATKIFHGHSVTVGPKVRGMGLGKELLKRSMDLAKSKECSHVYIMATSIYSQRIFSSMGYRVIHETLYSDFKDRDGVSEFFKDMGEHKSAQIVLFDLSTPY